MTDQQELSCPKCGARIYATDAQCVSCGVRLDEEEPADEPRPEVVPAAARSETQRGLKTALLIGKILVTLVRGAGMGILAWKGVGIIGQLFGSPSPTAAQLRNWNIVAIALGVITFVLGTFFIKVWRDAKPDVWWLGW